MLQSLSCVGILQFLTNFYAIKTTVAISGPDTELNCKYKLWYCCVELYHCITYNIHKIMSLYQFYLLCLGFHLVFFQMLKGTVWKRLCLKEWYLYKQWQKKNKRNSRWNINSVFIMARSESFWNTHEWRWAAQYTAEHCIEMKQRKGKRELSLSFILTHRVTISSPHSVTFSHNVPHAPAVLPSLPQPPTTSHHLS